MVLGYVFFWGGGGLNFRERVNDGPEEYQDRGWVREEGGVEFIMHTLCNNRLTVLPVPLLLCKRVT